MDVMSTTSVTSERGPVLLSIARTAVAAYLGRGEIARFDEPWLLETGASFVTLTQQGSLRGCIGSILPSRALQDDVRENAIAAAMRDPRFRPLGAEELDRTRFEVSILSPLERMTVRDEEDLIAQLEVGVDGLYLECGQRGATFLPQVWESLPEPHLFLRELRRKAGLAGDFWSPEMVWSSYRVEKWCEEE